jgi:hypothetical protein
MNRPTKPAEVNANYELSVKPRDAYKAGSLDWAVRALEERAKLRDVIADGLTTMPLRTRAIGEKETTPQPGTAKDCRRLAEARIYEIETGIGRLSHDDRIEAQRIHGEIELKLAPFPSESERVQMSGIRTRKTWTFGALALFAIGAWADVPFGPSRASTGRLSITWGPSELQLSPRQAWAVASRLCSLPPNGADKSAAGWIFGFPVVLLDLDAEVYPGGCLAVSTLTIVATADGGTVELVAQRRTDQHPVSSGPGPLEDGKPALQRVALSGVAQISTEEARAILVWASGKFSQPVTSVRIELELSSSAEPPGIRWMPTGGTMVAQ